TKPGERVLVAVDTHYDKRVVEAVARGLREMGASVDVVTVEAQPDREFTTTDEVDVIMRREPWTKRPRRWEGLPWIEELAAREKYDLLVHGKGGGIPNVPYRYEAIPWLQTDHFASAATVYPRDLHTLINMKTWRALHEESKETQYPCFPRPGLFWLWEVAIGTNPKIQRPPNIHLLSSGGFEWERRRSGIIHVGLGTRWRGSEEVWAGERGILY